MGNPDKIQIAFHLFVSGNMPYKQRAQLLVERAVESKQGKSGEGYTDNKLFVLSKGIESLIGAGAEIINLNYSPGKDFYHEVSYQDHTFFQLRKVQLLT